MKKIIICGLLSFIFLTAGHAQYDSSPYRSERTGYEGDYFSLEGALHVFKESTTLRDFERRLNRKENWVNNLDLNYDGRIDYIRVEHRRQGPFHAVVLQALVDRYNVQDVAVIEIEIIDRGEAILQIVGDEDLYGQEVYVEPLEGYADSRIRYNSNYGDYVNVYYWRPVQYILDRQYRPYVSSYRWGYYPTWWNPWRPYAWNAFRPRIVVYFNYYRAVPRHRVVRVHNFYRPNRSYCPTVVQRANNVRIKQGRSPIHRNSQVGQGRRDAHANQRDRVTQNERRSSGSTIYSRKSDQNPSVGRNGTRSNPEHDNIRTRSPQPKQGNSRTSEDNRRWSDSKTYSREPKSNSSVSRERTQSSSRQGNIKTRTPQAKPKSRSSSTRSRTYQSSSNEKARSSTPSRSRASSRSTTPSRKPTVKSRNTTPTPKSSVSRSSSSKRSVSKKSSTSRKRSNN
jgi:hypothetical protein